MFITKSAIALVMAGAATVLAPGAAAFAATAPGTHITCQISVLPDLPGSHDNRINAGDPTGRYLVGEALVDGRGNVPVIWRAGKPAEVPTPGTLGAVVDVNSAGAVIGQYLADDVYRGFVYRRGVRTELPPMVLGDYVRPTAINTRGDVVGRSETPFGSSRAVIWPADRPGTVRELPGVAGQTGVLPTDIDDDGTVVGTVYFADHADPYVWPRHGRPYVLRGPAGASGPDVSVIRHGWIGGSANDPLAKPVRWNPGTRTAQRVGLDEGWVTAINGHGTVAAVDAIAHRDGRVVALPGLLSDRWYSANTLADNGTAAGGATGPDGRHAVVWRGC